MRLKTTKKIAPLFILFFVLSTITAPARAFLPLIAEGVMLIAEGSTASNALAALTIGSVAGIIYMGSKTSGAGNKSGSIMDIPLGSTRDRPIDTPPGYTPPINNSAQPSPPSVGVGSITYRTNSNSQSENASPAASCVSYAALAGIAPQYTAYISDTQCGVYNANGSLYSTLTITKITTCQAGYTLSGSTCNLTNAALVQKPADGRCQILLNVAGFTIDPNDPECGELAAKTGTTVTPTKISTMTPGSTTKSEITINGDGSRTVTTTTANADGKTSTVTTITLTPAAAGGTATVSGSSSTQVNGVGTATGATIVAAAPAAPIDFPTDYNREVTQQGIKTDLDAVKQALDFSSTNALPSTELGALLDDVKTHVDSVTGSNPFAGFGFGFAPVLPAGMSCTPLVMTPYKGHTASYDWCPVVDAIRDILGVILYLSTGYFLLGLLTRKGSD
ncbi:MAG: hypothetical protein LLG15_01510 [Betaproteobacteria bacterium]|nr:hypothetical protein [Betaproteobacteria bacterium]